MTGSRPILFSELTRDQAREIADQALIVLPIGSTEQHGPHLPAGTDSIVVEHLARAAAAEAARTIPVIVAPTLPFGCSQHHLQFGATISITSETYYRLLMDVGRSLASSGFHRVFIVNGHGGNHDLAQLAARDLALETALHVASGSYWLIADEAPGPGRVPGHAGAFETSLMLEAAPGLVRTPLPSHTVDTAATTAKQRYRTEFHGQWAAIDGYSDDPRPATQGRGATYLANAVRQLASAFVDFYERCSHRVESPRYSS